MEPVEREIFFFQNKKNICFRVPTQQTNNENKITTIGNQSTHEQDTKLLQHLMFFDLMNLFPQPLNSSAPEPT